MKNPQEIATAIIRMFRQVPGKTPDPLLTPGQGFRTNPKDGVHHFATVAALYATLESAGDGVLEAARAIL